MKYTKKKIREMIEGFNEQFKDYNINLEEISCYKPDRQTFMTIVLNTNSSQIELIAHELKSIYFMIIGLKLGVWLKWLTKLV